MKKLIMLAMVMVGLLLVISGCTSQSNQYTPKTGETDEDFKARVGMTKEEAANTEENSKVGSSPSEVTPWPQSDKPVPVVTIPVSKKVMSRDEFIYAVYLKNPQQVIQAVGRPYKTDGDGTGKGDEWTYLEKTSDPITGKVDMVIAIRFDLGVVYRVIF